MSNILSQHPLHENLENTALWFILSTALFEDKLKRNVSSVLEKKIQQYH